MPQISQKNAPLARQLENQYMAMRQKKSEDAPRLGGVTITSHNFTLLCIEIQINYERTLLVTWQKIHREHT
jgi:hypothetical protein